MLSAGMTRDRRGVSLGLPNFVVTSGGIETAWQRSIDMKAGGPNGSCISWGAASYLTGVSATAGVSLATNGPSPSSLPGIFNSFKINGGALYGPDNLPLIQAHRDSSPSDSSYSFLSMTSSRKLTSISFFASMDVDFTIGAREGWINDFSTSFGDYSLEYSPFTKNLTYNPTTAGNAVTTGKESEATSIVVSMSALFPAGGVVGFVLSVTRGPEVGGFVDCQVRINGAIVGSKTYSTADFTFFGEGSSSDLHIWSQVGNTSGNSGLNYGDMMFRRIATASTLHENLPTGTGDTFTEKAEGYLAHTFGIESDLDAAHPYRADISAIVQ